MPIYTGFWAALLEATAENLNACVLQFGTAAARPAAGKKGVMYFATDTLALSYDNGTVWVGIQMAPVVKRKTTNEVVNNSAILQDDDHLTFAIGANEIWVVDIYLAFHTYNGGFKAAINAPAGASLLLVAFSLSGTEIRSYITTTVGEGQPLAPSGGVGVDRQGHLHATIVSGGTAGSITLQWAQVAATVENTTVYANSYLVATKQ